MSCEGGGSFPYSKEFAAHIRSTEEPTGRLSVPRWRRVKKEEEEEDDGLGEGRTAR